MGYNHVGAGWTDSRINRSKSNRFKNKSWIGFFLFTFLLEECRDLGVFLVRMWWVSFIHMKR